MSFGQHGVGTGQKDPKGTCQDRISHPFHHPYAQIESLKVPSKKLLDSVWSAALLCFHWNSQDGWNRPLARALRWEAKLEAIRSNSKWLSSVQWRYPGKCPGGTLLDELLCNWGSLRVTTHVRSSCQVVCSRWVSHHTPFPPTKCVAQKKRSLQCLLTQHVPFR